jgi:hypothetical protein
MSGQDIAATFSPITEGGPRVMFDDVVGIGNGTRGVGKGGAK